MSAGADAISLTADARASDGQDAESQTLIECHDCGAWHWVKPLAPGERAKCGRCGHTLYTAKERSIERALALQFAAAALVTIAIAFSFMVFRIDNRVQDNTLFTGIIRLAEFNLYFLAVLVLLVSILAPVLRATIGLYILIPMHFDRTPPFAGRLFRAMAQLRPWAMMEVYLFGVFIAYTNLTGLGAINFQAAAFAFCVLIPVMLAADGMLDPAKSGIKCHSTKRRLCVARQASPSRDGGSTHAIAVNCHCLPMPRLMSIT